MTEFATRPLPFTFMPMPAIPMANRRPKRKSGNNVFLEDESESVRGEEPLPPLKKTKRSYPTQHAEDRGYDAIASSQAKMTRSLTTENDDNSNAIFSKGPSRAKRARQKQKEQENHEKTEQGSIEQPQRSMLREKNSIASREPPSSRSRRSKARDSPEQKPQTSVVSDERPLPTLTKTSMSRKPKAYNFDTPEKEVTRVRRSPRLKEAQIEDQQRDVVTNDKPLTVPLAAIEDTPLVRKRNKEMREAKGHRRSSLGLRGRRASSLTNGHIACPHPDVHPGDFFKHLDAEMIETQRMQQLLAWCAKRAQSDKRARGRDVLSNARAAARVIEEEILADLTEKKLNINWWDVSDNSGADKGIIKKPNPRNEDHQRKIAALEKQLQDLNQEKNAWEDISEKAPERLPKKHKEGNLRPNSLNTELLRKEEVATMPGFEDSGKSIGVIQEILSRGRGSLEFKIDQFSHGVHKAHQLSRHAKRVSENVLANASSLLEVREEAARKAAGTNELPLHEVLKSISHLGKG